MENLTPQSNPSPVIVDTMPTEASTPVVPTVTVVKTSYHHKRRIGWIIVAVAVLIVAGIVAWMLYHKKAPLTPEQTLQALKDSSRPVTSTPKDRATDLKATAQRSAPVKASASDRDTMLNTLK